MYQKKCEKNMHCVSKDSLKHYKKLPKIERVFHREIDIAEISANNIYLKLKIYETNYSFIQSIINNLSIYNAMFIEPMNKYFK